jgi:hypothetical protein
MAKKTSIPRPALPLQKKGITPAHLLSTTVVLDLVGKTIILGYFEPGGMKDIADFEPLGPGAGYDKSESADQNALLPASMQVVLALRQDRGRELTFSDFKPCRSKYVPYFAICKTIKEEDLKVIRFSTW